MATHVIVIHYPSGREDSIAVGENGCVIGSAAECDVTILDAAVEKQQLAIYVSGNVLEIENVATMTPVWLNGVQVSSRSTFIFGDVIRIGNETISLQQPCELCSVENNSPADAQKIRENIARDVRIGWVGCHRVLEKLARYISSGEAKTAAHFYGTGRNAFGAMVCMLFLGSLTAAFLDMWQCYEAALILRIGIHFFANASILLLVGLFRVSFSGRVIWPLVVFMLSLTTPTVGCSLYWDKSSDYSSVVCSFFLGWLMDYGAGFVFQNRAGKVVKRLLTSVVSSIFLTLIYWRGIYATEIFEAIPYVIWGLVPFVAFGGVYKKLLALNTCGSSDALFVAEIASKRASKRMLWQVIAVVLLVVPVFRILSLLGEDERRQWPSDDSTVVWTDDKTKEEAWFWEERGRYFNMTDLEVNHVFQIPISVLTTPATSNEYEEAISPYYTNKDIRVRLPPSLLRELLAGVTLCKAQEFLSNNSAVPDEHSPEFAKFNEAYIATVQSFLLSSLATNVCTLVDKISANSGDIASYSALCKMLSEYRVRSTEVAEFARTMGKGAICLVCETIRSQHYGGGSVATSYAAKFAMGINLQIRDNVGPIIESIELEQANALSPCLQKRVKFSRIDTISPCSQDYIRGRSNRALKCKIGLPLVFVLAILATLILYRRGADSSVGLWLGLGLSANVSILTALVADMNGGILPCVEQAIWRESFSNPVYSLLACWFSFVNTLDMLFQVLGTLAQAVLFVRLCWPSVDKFEKWDRFWLFVGKVAALFFFPFLLEKLFSTTISSSSLVICVFEVTLLGMWGWWLRRKWRQYTEIPHLGFPFFLGWVVARISTAIFVAWVGLGPDPISERDVSLVIYQWLSTAIEMPILNMHMEFGMILCMLSPILVLLCWVWLFIKQRFLNAMSIGGIILTVFVFGVPIITRFIVQNLTTSFADNVLISKVGIRIVSAVVIAIVSAILVKICRNSGRRVFMHGVYKIERSIASVIERAFDEYSNKTTSIVRVLSCMNVSSFAFYERVSKDDFTLTVSRNWNGRELDTFSLSDQLRDRLGRKNELIDFHRLPFCPELFFLSFELWRIHKSTNSSCLIPISLGISLRGLLLIDADCTMDIPDDPSLTAKINSFGLSSVTPQ